MKRRIFSGVVALCAACAFGVGAISARAQDASGSVDVVASGGETEKGKDCCTYLGIFMDELTAGMKEKAGYPHETGVVISKVSPGGPAEKAGILGGDICYLFNGVKVEDSAHLAKLVRGRKGGEKVAIVIYREGKEKKLFVKLERREPLPSVKDELGSYSVEDLSKLMGDQYTSMSKLYLQSATRGHLGMALVDLNEDLAPYFSVKKGEGALVFSVEEDSPAGKAGVKGGDVIVSVNGVAVGASSDVSSELADIRKGDMVSLDVLRRGVRKSFEIEADAGLATSQLFVAPFEQSGIKIKKAPVPPNWVEADRSGDEARKLKEEMKALQKRLKDLEERLGNVEKKE
ncbi:MAG: PDZ domain-containing protein [Candidatus Krumholzibacteria bacterium]|nr:PDZ domain-containing protein [Candidatus Krumholzibacteria bacterium]